MEKKKKEKKVRRALVAVQLFLRCRVWRYRCRLLSCTYSVRIQKSCVTVLFVFASPVASFDALYYTAH